jgi:hypothetical protein
MIGLTMEKWVLRINPWIELFFSASSQGWAGSEPRPFYQHVKKLSKGRPKERINQTPNNVYSSEEVRSTCPKLPLTWH